MPWATLTLKQVRVQVRGEITTFLAGASFIGNSVLRVMADATAGMAHLVLRYLDWQSRQYLPDTAESEWLDRHADIWLVNADGSIGRKVATLAHGSISIGGLPGLTLPTGTQFQSTSNFLYETTEMGTFESAPITLPIIAINPGSGGNLDEGEPLAIVVAVSGIDSTATVLELSGGTDQETDEELRVRVLERIQKPPMGGDADDYVAWALSYPGVTRAWCSPLEMGIGTVTVRFMMDDLRASNNGFPTPDDVAAVSIYLNSVRPVAVEDFFVEAPIPEFINFQIVDLVSDDANTRANIEVSCDKMITAKAAPAYAVDGVPQEAQTIYREWVSVAISESVGVDHFDLVMDDHPMPNAGCLGVLGDITYG
jgi:uncharacterized phage protein gp47/JayE